MGAYEGPTNFLNVGASPSLMLNFAREKSLRDQISGKDLVTFTRSSTGTYVGADGLIKTAGADEPRFDHDPATGESLGLLIEESRTNLAKKSGELNNTIYWTQNYNVNATTATSITAPDGSTDTWKLVVANNTSQQRFALNGNQGTFGANTYTWSVFAKAAEYSYLGISLYDGNYYRATFNLSNGTASNIYDATATITPYPNGWYRCSITATTTANLRNTSNYADGFWPYVGDSTAGASQTGDGTSGVYVWGPQLEVGSFLTSYVTTGDGTSSVTRSADIAKITGTNLTSFYNQSKGTLFTSFRPLPLSTGSRYVQSSTIGSTLEAFYIRSTPTGSDSAIIDGGVTQAYNLINYTRSEQENSKHAYAYELNNFGVSAQGQLGSGDTSCTMPTITRFDIGSLYQDSATFLNGYISQLFYYPARISDIKLQQMTKVFS